MFSIVIPTYNQCRRLQRMLSTLKDQKRIEELTVYVINDGSTDGTESFLNSLQYSWLKVIHQNNQGRSAARNNGIRQVKTKYVLLLDDDMLLAPGFIEAHMKAQIQREGVYIGEIFNIPNENVDPFFERDLDETSLSAFEALEQEDLLVNLSRYFYRWNKESNPISWVCMVAGNVSFPTKYYLDANGFDENFVGWGVEDHELAYRFFKNGASFHFLKEGKAFHLDHRKVINRTQLLENVLYFYKKSRFDKQVKAYVDFTTAKISMGELYRRVMDAEPKANQVEIFFRPNAHLKKKESKEIKV